jgi:hypothetical protein
VYDVERGQLKDVRPIFGQTDTTVSKNSWGDVTYLQTGLRAVLTGKKRRGAR